MPERLPDFPGTQGAHGIGSSGFDRRRERYRSGDESSLASTQSGRFWWSFRLSPVHRFFHHQRPAGKTRTPPFAERSSSKCAFVAS